ncbi:conserved hypothetical protein [Candida albicans WO-1]|uniref:Uncharacterized protein n=1 Tax=Candida albicans (strain WO-1) TaxID=294748 RepID=C4YNH4_CANAW|nr:conserved hypothetical protein [Candida albicans WO-1]
MRVCCAMACTLLNFLLRTSYLLSPLLSVCFLFSGNSSSYGSLLSNRGTFLSGSILLGISTFVNVSFSTCKGIIVITSLINLNLITLWIEFPRITSQCSLSTNGIVQQCQKNKANFQIITKITIIAGN